MNRRLRKYLLIAAGIVVGLAVIIIIGVKLFLTDERLRAYIEPAMEAQLGRDVSIGAFEVRLLRSFPNLSVGARDLFVHTPDQNGEVQPDLASAKRVWVDISLLPLLQSRVYINSLEIQEPQILVEVYEDFSTNLIEVLSDSADVDDRESKGEDESAAVIKEITVEKFSIIGGQLAYSHADGTLFTVSSLNVSISARLGDIGEGVPTVSVGDVEYAVDPGYDKNLVEVEGVFMAEDAYFETGGIPYVNGWDLRLDLNALADLDSSWVQVQQTAIGIENLQLTLAGLIEHWDEELIGMALEVKAPEASIEELWSLLPAVLVKDVEGISGTGKVDVAATIRGDLGEDQLPALDAAIKVADGSVNYPGLPSAISQINVDANLSLDKLTLSDLRAKADGAELSLTGSVQNFASPIIAVDLQIVADLGKIPSYIPLEEGTTLSGDLDVNTRLSGALDEVDQLRAEGLIGLANVNYTSSVLEQPIENLSGKLQLNNSVIEIRALDLGTGASDVHFTGMLENYAALFADSVEAGQEAIIRGHATSRRFDVSEQLSDDTTATGPLVLPDVIAHITFAADALEYEGIVLKKANGAIEMQDGIISYEGGSDGFLQGILRTAGKFDLSNPLNPVFDGSFGLEQVRASQFFTAFESLNHVANIGTFLDGFFDSQATIGLRMDEELSPILETLFAEGTFGAKSGTLAGMPVQEKLAEITGLASMTSLAVGAWTHKFSVSGEKLHVHALEMSAGDFTFGVNGSQGFDGSMDYMLRVELPESAAATLEAAPVATALNTAIKPVSQLANATLVDPETKRITLDFLARGTFSNPELKLNTEMFTSRLEARALALVQGARLEAQAKIDSLENETRLKAEAELDAQRVKLEDAAKERANELLGGVVDSSGVSSEVDSLKEKGGEVLKDRLKGLLKRKKKN